MLLASWLSCHCSTSLLLFSSKTFPHGVFLLQISLLLLVDVVLVGYAWWLHHEALVSLKVRLTEGLIKTFSSIPKWCRIRRHQHSRKRHSYAESVLELTSATLGSQGQYRDPIRIAKAQPALFTRFSRFCHDCLEGGNQSMRPFERCSPTHAIMIHTHNEQFMLMLHSLVRVVLSSSVVRTGSRFSPNTQTI